MGKNRIKTVTAGRLVYAVCYSQPMASDTPAERAAKSRSSSAARQKINFRAAWQRLELELAANFSGAACWATLTYDDDHLPPDRAAAKKEINKFLRRLREQYRRRGWELKYIYNTESVPDDPSAARRLHHHIVLSPYDAETVKSLWHGGQAHTEKLLEGDYDTYETRARYMVKERHPETQGLKRGERAWTPSRNLAKPVVTSELVADSVTITPPPGAFVLERYGDTNYFGQYTYLKYLLPDPRKPRRRRL